MPVLARGGDDGIHAYADSKPVVVATAGKKSVRFSGNLEMNTISSSGSSSSDGEGSGVLSAAEIAISKVSFQAPKHVLQPSSNNIYYPKPVILTALQAERERRREGGGSGSKRAEDFIALEDVTLPPAPNVTFFY